MSSFLARNAKRTYESLTIGSDKDVVDNVYENYLQPCIIYFLMICRCIFSAEATEVDGGLTTFHAMFFSSQVFVGIFLEYERYSLKGSSFKPKKNSDIFIHTGLNFIFSLLVSYMGFNESLKFVKVIYVTCLIPIGEAVLRLYHNPILSITSTLQNIFWDHPYLNEDMYLLLLITGFFIGGYAALIVNIAEPTKWNWSGVVERAEQDIHSNYWYFYVFGLVLPLATFFIFYYGLEVDWFTCYFYSTINMLIWITLFWGYKWISILSDNNFENWTIWFFNSPRIFFLSIGPAVYCLSRIIFIIGYIFYVLAIVVPISSIAIIYFCASIYIVFQIIWLYTDMEFDFMNSGSSLLFFFTYMSGFVCDKPKEGLTSHSVVPIHTGWLVPTTPPPITTSGWCYTRRNGYQGALDIKTWNTVMDLPLLLMLIHIKCDFYEQWTLLKEICLYFTLIIIIFRQPVPFWNITQSWPFITVSLLEVSMGLFLLYSHFNYHVEAN